MKSSRILNVCAVALMLVQAICPARLSANESVLPSVGMEATSAAKELKPIDVALDEDGALRGKLLDSQGEPLAAKSVTVYKDGESAAVTPTAEDGSFQVDGLQGGLYAVAADQGGGIFRVWKSNTAPPSAKQLAMIYNDGSIVRGNFRSPKTWIKNPVVLTAVVLGAIALPIILHDDEAS